MEPTRMLEFSSKAHIDSGYNYFRVDQSRGFNAVIIMLHRRDYYKPIRLTKMS